MRNPRDDPYYRDGHPKVRFVGFGLAGNVILSTELCGFV
jgi:hypothetical protein